MSGIVTLGRSLLLRQLLSSVLIVALGAFAFLIIHGLEGAAMSADPRASGGPALIAAIGGAASLVLCFALAAALLTALVSLPVIYYTISKPLRTVAAAMEDVALGELTVPIAYTARTDEIGAIARALLKVRDAAQIAAQREAGSGAAAASKLEARSQLVTQRVESFAGELEAHLRRLGTMTKRLSEAAESMTAAARHANDGSDRATSASADAAGDVSSVATASEQLLDSIEEISRQVVQSTNVVRTAVERAVDTNTGMGRLSTAAQKVGDVVSMISRIAAQTNLLALNATIEAARAGEAGRGFAVVAQEVKTLATQTAKATQDITGQIAEMLEATDLSVEAIDKIQKKISEVEHISTIIAAAVHEQGAATQEIARNVRSAAAGTATMSSHIENVVRSVGETAMSASSVAKLAHELDDIAAGMAVMVANFSQTMKAA